MDLGDLDTRELSTEGVDVPLFIDGDTRLGDDDKPVTFRLKGVVDPDVMQAVMHATKAPSQTPDEALAKDLKVLRAAVLGWSDNWAFKGEKLAFSRANLDKVMGVPKIRAALMAEIAKDHHFMKGA